MLHLTIMPRILEVLLWSWLDSWPPQLMATSLLSSQHHLTILLFHYHLYFVASICYALLPLFTPTPSRDFFLVNEGSRFLPLGWLGLGGGGVIMITWPIIWPVKPFETVPVMKGYTNDIDLTWDGADPKCWSVRFDSSKTSGAHPHI